MKEFASFTITNTAQQHEYGMITTTTGGSSRSSSGSSSSPLRISIRERKDHQEGRRGTTSSLLSSSCPSNSMMTMMMASTRKVSFAEEGEHGTIFTDDPLASFRIPGLFGNSAAATANNSATTTTTTTIEAETLNVLNEEQRVVSNETIDSLPKKITMAKRMNNSRSLPTLPRSGDLKSLLVSSSTSSTSHHHYQEEEEEEEGQHVPSVSEDCLLTRAHEHEENDDDMMNSYTFFSEFNHSPSPSLEHTRHNIATSSTSSNCSAATRNATKSKTTTCSGWGQFVDFMPMTSLDHPKRRSLRTKTKPLSPISRRRNNGSTTSKFLLRRHHLQHPYNILEKSSTIHRKMRKGHLMTSLLYSTHRNNIHNNNNTIKQQPQQQQERHDNYHHTTSTNDIVNSFQVQLSL